MSRATASSLVLPQCLRIRPTRRRRLRWRRRHVLRLSRDDIAALLKQKPMVGMDMLTVVSRQFHASQQLVRIRASRNSNDVIEEEMSFGDRIADSVARFGGRGPSSFCLERYWWCTRGLNITLKGRAWDPYPFILLNLFLSMLAAIQAPVIMMRPESSGHERPCAW